MTSEKRLGDGLLTLMASVRAGYHHHPRGSSWSNILLSQLRDALGCDNFTYDDFYNPQKTRQLLLPRSNLQLHIISTTKTPRYVLKVANRCIETHDESEAYILMALAQRIPPKKKSNLLKYDMKMFDLMGQHANNQYFNWHSVNTYNHQFYRYFFRSNIFFVIDSHEIYTLRDADLSNFHQYDSRQCNGFEPMKFILLGEKGWWLREGPWIALTEQIVQEIIAENAAATLQRTADRMQRDRDDILKRNADLDLAEKLLSYGNLIGV